MLALFDLWALGLGETGASTQPSHISSGSTTGFTIRTLGDSILKQRCREVKPDEIRNRDAHLVQAIDTCHEALADFRRKNGFGRAISAPQVGYGISLVALKLDGKSYTMINPKITHRSDEMFSLWDDCLSFPELMACVRRHASISVAFVDELGDQHEWNNLPRDLSELLQHEIDHLNGILAVDIAESPGEGGSADQQSYAPVINRQDYLMNKAKFDAMVDYSIPLP